MSDLFVRRIPSTDVRLGRHVVHDSASRGFASPRVVNASTWRSKIIRIWDPVPNPNQCHGECTFVAKCVQCNAAGNRKLGVILGMDTAHQGYSLATTLDPFQGSWTAPTWEDTGSSGLGAAKAAQQLGIGGEYHWRFDGAMGVIQEVQDDKVVNVGTRWDNNMFTQDPRGRVRLGGGLAGGHEWSVIGFDAHTGEAIGLCWWGSFRKFRISLDDLAELLADDGDALVQVRV